MSHHYHNGTPIADARTADWFYMSSPLPMLGCLCLYLCLTLVAPFVPSVSSSLLRPPLLCYNFIMVFLNAYITSEIFLSTRAAGYSFWCQPINYSTDEREMRVVYSLYLYTLSKPVELLDTLFLVLKGRRRQLTLLHVYHHASMHVFIWLGMKYGGGGMAYIVAMLNSFVHTVMYTYYGLAALFPGTNFWWKRYLTVLQMSQFVIGVLMALQMTYYGCDYPLFIKRGFVFLAVSFFILFSNFWLSTYTRQRKQLQNGQPNSKRK